ncbi:hypothetical protein Z3_145 [Bacillus phage Z3]|nr:hypothetical protein Z3_145 [Bacillus phage Z3]
MKVLTKERYGNFEVFTASFSMEVSIHIETGIVNKVEISESALFNQAVTIQELDSFIGKARAEYRKFIGKKEIDTFTLGGE